MYSQDRSFRDTSNDYDRNSDRRADQNHRSRQRLGDSYVGESAYLKKSAKQRHEIEPSSRYSESTVPKRFDEADSTRVPGRLGETDYSASRRSPMEGSRWDGHENGYPLRSLGSTEQNGHLNVSSNLNNSNHPQLYNHYNSSVGYGDPYRENEESDRGSEMGSEYSLGNYKYQPWMDKIVGDTFKKGYFDRVSFRPTLHHNSQTPLSISRQFKQPEDLNPVLPGKPGAAEDKGRCAPWTILCIVVGVILIGCVAGVVAYFVTRGEDPPFKYYVVSSELRLEKEFSPRLSDSSSEEFKNLSGKFCGVMKEALQKNTTEYGNQYKSCDVTEFKNGSIIVVYRLYYVFTVVVITKEKVHQDLNNSLTSVDSNRSQLSDLTILTASVTFTVEVQTFETDPVASSVTTTTTTTTMAPTSTLPETTTIPTPTDSTTTETTTELESTTEGPTTMSPESSSGGPTTSPPDDETTTDDTPLSSTTTPPVVTPTSSPTEETTTTESTTTESTTVTPADSSTESTTSSPTVSSTESTTTTPTVSSTESTTTTPTVSSTESTTTTPTVSSTESTTSSPTVSSTESTTSLPTVSSTESTTSSPTVSSTESTTTTPTVSSTESTTTTPTVSSTESTTSSPTVSSTESTTRSPTVSSTESTTSSPTVSSTESTTRSPIVSSTESTTSSPTVSSTESTTTTPTVSSTESTTTTPTVSSTERTTSSPTVSSTESTTSSPTVSSTESTTTTPTVSSTESTTSSPTVSSTESTTSSPTVSSTESTTTTPTVISTESSTVTPTVSSTEITTTKYTADVMVYPVKAVIGEVTTADTCVISPDGDWTQANVTVTNGGTSYVLGKFKPNGQFERPDSLERFDVSMSKSDSKIVVRLILNLTAPTSDVCSFYTMSCSILMNDTAQTIASNGTEISFTAPVSDVSIDSDTNYKEGDRMTFNCSSKVDPDYSFVSVELIKASTLLTTIPGPKPGVDRNSDCSVDFSWVSGPPTPLTIYENDVIVRCVVYNKLLNITKTAEKMLNVSAADVAFTQYSYKNITEAFIEIPCIARSSSQIFQDLEIIRDGVPIASMNRSVNDSRYSVRSEAYNGDVRLILSISSVKCQDQGTYHCKMYKKDNTSLVSPAMSFFVEGSKPTLTLHPDIYEPFARLGLNHVCSTDHVGDERNGNYIEVQIIKPGNSLQFRYPNNIPDSEKDFNPKNNITYMNITGMSAQFLLVSHLKTSSNISCNIRETITFLLDLNMEFDNSTLKCVLKDDREEFSSVESRIAVIPGNYCEGYNDNTKRKHPSNNCNFYVKCEFKEGKMHATGNQCQVGFCFDFSKEQCVTCDSTFICEELTTPGPTTTTVTLPPGKKYVSCNDSSHLVGTSAIVTCIVLDTTFQSLNISFLPAHAPRSEELIGEVLPDGTVKSQDSSSVVLMTNFATLPRTLSMTIQRVECSLEGQFEIMSVGTNSSFAPSLERFKFDVLGNLTKFELHSSSVFQEGTLIEFNCTATLDESHAKIKGYYKKQSDSSFIEIEGLTTVIEKNLSHCLTDVIWKPTNLFTADASFNHAQIKCEMSDWPLAQVMTNITVNKADVAFETYKIEAEIGSRVSVKCLTRNVNSLSFIRIQKVNITANTSNTVGNISFPSTTFSQSGMTVSYTTDSLTLTISPLDCKDEGYYTCVVGKQDNSEVQAPAMLHVQPQNLPKLMLVNLALNPDIKENDYDERNVHSCSGDTGYPAGLGYLSLMFTNPTTNASYVYDEKTVTEAMKTPLSTSLFKVTLASGLSIVIKDDEEPSVVNCNGTKQIKFLIKATRDWNKAKLRCSVKNSSGEITSTAVEEEIYVIPNSICDNTNGSDTYLHHEKVDGCKYYVRCHNNKPTGQTCTGQLCFDPQNLPCNWCWNVACESEKDPTTTDSMTETTTFPVTTQTTPVTTQATQCPLLSCTPVFVFGMEDANLVCDLNSTAAYEMITVTKNGQSLMTIYSNGTTAYHSNELNKYEGLVSSSFMFTIKNASCSDRADYTFTAEVENLGPCFKTASLDLKAKPEKAELKIDYRWTNGTKTGTHVCTGNTGHPPGTLSLEVKDGESGVYRNYTPSIITNTTTFENCTNKATLSFSIDFSNEHLQGDYIRCVSNNRETLSTSESPFYSQEVLINPLPEDACYVNGDFPYPGKCRQYLQCANNITYIQKCGTTTCFDVSARQCNYNCNSCTT